MASFVGLDLAWKETNPTGAAAFRAVDGGGAVELRELRADLVGARAVLDFVARHEEPGATVVAVDAPLVVRNARGRRPCEAEAQRRFRRAHAGPHPTHLGRPHLAGVALARALEARGYAHPPAPGRAGAGWRPAGRVMLEVFPHPAHVVLFARERIVKYKRGRVDARRRGLRELADEMRRHLFGAPPFRCHGALAERLAADPEALRGGALKAHEDALDALTCAWLAHHLAARGFERSEMLGDPERGYIVVPTRAADPPRARS